MNLIFSGKTIGATLAGALLIAGLSTPAFADNKEALKDAIGADKIAEVKTGDIKSADAKAAEPMTKAPVDTDFKKLDSSGDGKISLKEAVKDKSLASLFDATDANHDGMIEPDEYANYKTATAVKGTDPAAVTPTN